MNCYRSLIKIFFLIDNGVSSENKLWTFKNVFVIERGMHITLQQTTKLSTNKPKKPHQNTTHTSTVTAFDS